MSGIIADCTRCGMRRTIAKRRDKGLCVACKYTHDRNPDETCALPPGKWVATKGVQIFAPSVQRDGNIGRPRLGEMFRWDDDEARRAHCAYVRGHFDAWSIEGERVYSRWAKARQKATRQTRQEAA